MANVVAMKSMSFGCQIALGYILSSDTYAVFAAAAAALTLTSGLQNSGVNKVLIQQQNRYDSIAADFGGFAVYLSLIGSALMIAVSVLLARLYNMPSLIAVLSLTAISIPLLSLNSLYAARQSIGLRFRDASLFSVSYTALYSVLLVGFAFAGAAEFSVAAATVIAVAAQLYLYRHFLGSVPINMSPSFRSVRNAAGTLKWTILSSYLFGFSQNSDFLVLGSLLEKVEMGNYYFGYMLSANIGLLLSLSISQILMPIFSKMSDSPDTLRESFASSSSAIIVLCGCLCLCVLGVGPELVHITWQGKWDNATIVMIATISTFPVRILASMGAVAMEVKGRWGWRTGTLAYDAIGMAVSAGLGANFAGLTGAAVAVAAHRGMSGLVSMPVGMAGLGFRAQDIVSYLIRTITPYIVASAILFAAKSSVPSIPQQVNFYSAFCSVAITGCSVFAFCLLSLKLNPSLAESVSSKASQAFRRCFC